jgi:hypothetical protein
MMQSNVAPGSRKACSPRLSAALRGLVHWIAGGTEASAEISSAWLVTQCMWTAPDACARRDG